MSTLSGIPKLGSADKIIAKGDEWMDLRRTADGYTYSHEKRQVAAVLLTRDDDKKPILGRFEPVPPHRDGIQLVALTGTVEEGEELRKTMLREAEEESGYKLADKDLTELGIVRPAKGSDQKIHLFTAAVDDAERGKADGDGTANEHKAHTAWVSVADAINSKDPVLVTLVTRWQRLDKPEPDQDASGA